jgi:hypothetical protein
MASFVAAEQDAPLPDLTAPHVIDMLMDVGPVENTGMGQIPISWRTLDAWAARAFVRPSAWECRTLRRLSAEYLAELHAAEDPMRPPPWSDALSQAGRVDADAQLRAVLTGQ